ncbi:DUF4350 domain-containing protein [candidate division KSB1 bacterium]|nr:DUF4350 domain-containing protein [candidate division KSB1 bacterium]NIR70314.1 DUF4350 domain-containing protein [candidate division KSB1 bacterium]NIS27618.1 DUF4350 domain-containing protein [candidate division KSB1 bacterium]NIT74458.1 DUF4350 domain-containing protein [candidate division KSB1 bacterium]NIU28983.1 DUF4350 domain-containing protein [candidate division KSB1 bacterium]
MTRLANQNLKYIGVLAFTVVIALTTWFAAPEPIDWSASFSNKDKIPYGNYILFSLLPDMFPDQTVATEKRPLYSVLDDRSIQNTNYVILNTRFAPDKLDTRELLEFVANGNCAFVAAQRFGGKFADSLDIATSINIITLDSMCVNFVNPELRAPEDYIYRKGTVDFYFSKFDTARTVALGKNSENEINFIKMNFGEGALFLSTLPFAFTNYNVLFRNNSDYIFKALSYLPVQHTIWDEYYKVGNRISGSPLRFVLSHTSLKWAYYLAFGGIILFILFEGKRKQRIIPVIKPLPNTTLEFTETVGRLYYQKGDHKNLAEKKITLFLDFIRNHFRLKTGRLADGFLEKLSDTSGVSKEEIKELFSKIETVRSKNKITERELIDLHTSMETFYQQVT